MNRAPAQQADPARVFTQVFDVLRALSVLRPAGRVQVVGLVGLRRSNCIPLVPESATGTSPPRLPSNGGISCSDKL
jgi:hypothetical protein